MEIDYKSRALDLDITRYDISRLSNEDLDAFDDERFGYAMSLLTSASRGSKYQRRLITYLCGVESRPADNNGDFLLSGLSGEAKESDITSTNKCMNLVQMRLDHNIDFYILIVFCLKTGKTNYHLVPECDIKELDIKSRCHSGGTEKRKSVDPQDLSKWVTEKEHLVEKIGRLFLAKCHARARMSEMKQTTGGL